MTLKQLGPTRLGLLLIVAAFVVHDWRLFLTSDPPVSLEVREDIRLFEDLSTWPPGAGSFENGGFVPCMGRTPSESGWCLPAGRHGTLRYSLPVPPVSRGLLVRLFFFRKQPEATSRLAVYREGAGVPQRVFDNVHFADARLDLSDLLDGSPRPVVLRFEGDNPTGHPDVFVQYFEVRVFSDPLPAVPSLPRMILTFLALGLCLLPLVSWRALLPVWAVLTVGVALRYAALQQALWLPLDWDALTFRQFASDMRLFTDHGFFSAQFGTREPLFILLVKGLLRLWGDTETGVRFVSLSGSLLVILLMYRLGRRLFGARLGWLGALAVAVCLPLVRESARGLRLEWEIALLLVFCEAAFLTTFKSRWLQAVVVGALAGALGLFRMTYLIGLVPVVAAACVVRRPGGIRTAAVAVLVMVGLCAPYRWNGYRLHGRWLWDVHGDWWANVEFAGQPGWRSKAEVWRDSQGPSAYLSPLTYLFTTHSVPEFVLGTARGFWKLGRHMDLVAYGGASRRALGIDLTWVDGVFQLAGFLGLGLAAARPGLRWMLPMVLWLAFPWAFLYDRGLTEPWRQTYQVFPFVVFGALLSASALAKRLSDARR